MQAGNDGQRGVVRLRRSSGELACNARGGSHGSKQEEGAVLSARPRKKKEERHGVGGAHSADVASDMWTPPTISAETTLKTRRVKTNGFDSLM